MFCKDHERKCRLEIISSLCFLQQYAGIEIWKLLDEYYGESEEDHLSVKWGIEYYNATH